MREINFISVYTVTGQHSLTNNDLNVYYVIEPGDIEMNKYNKILAFVLYT